MVPSCADPNVQFAEIYAEDLTDSPAQSLPIVDSPPVTDGEVSAEDISIAAPAKAKAAPGTAKAKATPGKAKAKAKAAGKAKAPPPPASWATPLDDDVPVATAQVTQWN